MLLTQFPHPPVWVRKGPGLAPGRQKGWSSSGTAPEQPHPLLSFLSSWAQAPGESGIEDASQVRARLPASLCKQNPVDLGNQTEQVLPRPGFPRKGQAGFVEFEGQSSFELVETSQF